jgi:hypothetical protein
VRASFFETRRSLAIVKESADILGDALARLQFLEREKRKHVELRA